MKLCISSLAWNIDNKNKIYDFLSKKEIKFIEIVPFKISNLGLYDEYNNYIKLKKEWEDFGLQAVSMQSLHFGLNNCSLFNSEMERKNLYEYTLKSIEVASILGIEHIVFGSPKLRIIPENMSNDEANDIAIEFFTKLNDEAIKYNVLIGIEPNSKDYGTNFLTNTKDTFEFVKKINLKNVKINLDLSTIILENENISQSIDLVNSLNYNFHCHISIPYLKNDYIDYKNNLIEYLYKLKTSKVNHYSIETVINNNNEIENINTINEIIDFIKSVEEETI
ncbi:TIM barrel protein [Brachyspira pulli]|uniref:sugar phosphate isomerase/epimerase family protein n=1 Tax=Brachyspira pulli TaxID=310721 RepID=UPI003003BCB5